MTDGKGLTVHHYHGPAWELQDGSIVHSDSAKATHYLPLNPKSIHWLELPGLDGKGKLAKITLIQRVDTAGGTGPAPSECSGANSGEQRRAPYRYVSFLWQVISGAGALVSPEPSKLGLAPEDLA